MRILAICGSIRRDSSNGFLLAAAKNVLQQNLVNLNWVDFELRRLPFFDPELQYSSATPEVVTEFRDLAEQADLLLISTPEYAHGVPGILKNGLEWLFCEQTQKLRAALLVGSAQGEAVVAQLLDILPTMDFDFSKDRILLVRGARTKVKDRERNGEIIFLDTSLAEEFERFVLGLV